MDVKLAKGLQVKFSDEELECYIYTKLYDEMDREPTDEEVKQEIEDWLNRPRDWQID